MSASQEIVGREAEFATLTGFLSAIREGPTALVLQGEPGIGKTTLWRRCLESARREVPRVLTSRPAEAEAKLSYGSLDDLLEGMVDEALPALSTPKRRALEIALLRSPPKGRTPDQLTICRAVLEVLRDFTSRGPLLIAIDDVQWLDVASARVLEFVARRLENEPVGFLFARRVEGADRPPAPLGLEQALEPERVGLVDLPPLDLAAIHEVLRSRFGASFPRHVLVRLYEQSRGNPFFALEIARVLIAQDLHPGPNDELPVPGDLRRLLRRRLDALAPELRDLLLYAAALSQPTVALLTTARGGTGLELIEHAANEGVIEISDQQVRFVHPLLASVVRDSAPADKLRDVHARLAEVTGDREERAHHLARATTGPDPSIADAVEEAAKIAAARGAPSVAAILSEDAQRLTPEDQDADRNRRSVGAADYHFRAGDTSRARELLEEALGRMSPGPDRAWAFCTLGSVWAQEESWPKAEDLFKAALAEIGDEFGLRAQIHQQMALARLVAGDIPGAVVQARHAVNSAERVADPRLTAFALEALAWFHFLLGRGDHLALLKRADSLGAGTEFDPLVPWQLLQPGMGWGLILKWTDDFDGARARLEERHLQAIDTGDERYLPFILYHLSELECWAGNWNRATEYAEEGDRIALLTEQQAVRAAVLYSRSLVETHRGLVDPAQAHAEDSLELSQRAGNVPVMTLALSVLGFIDVSLGDFEGAHEHLGPMSQMLAATGLGEPGVVRFVPDEIESLIALGEFDTAKALVGEFEGRARELDRVWALATGARCRALLDAATGDLDGAAVALERALEEHKRLPIPFELGRTLLAAGAIHRRSKRKRAAKEALEGAMDIFERLGAPLWSKKARRELGRVGLRPAAPLGLTPGEQRVAELVAVGYTNKEVADALFISPKTVDSNLTRIYRKLRVRSRTELAAKLSEEGRAAPV